MRRRLMDVSRLKRLPVRKTKSTEPTQSSSLLYMKLFSGWCVIILLDVLVGFRAEYMYPAFMFLRSVVDSYKYQGLIFSLLFVCLVAYLDILCWTLLTGPWLFMLASSCVWLEYIRTSDHLFGYTSVLLWMLFVYVEVTHRLHSVPPPLVDFSRPFAAHCIGYPVVTVSFLVKHQVMHYIRQRQQRLVSDENSSCYEILQKALPIAIDQLLEEEESGRANVDAGDGKARITNKPSLPVKVGGTHSGKERSKSVNKTSNSTNSSVAAGISKGVGKSVDSKTHTGRIATDGLVTAPSTGVLSSSNALLSAVAPSSGTSGSATIPTGNSRPLSAGRTVGTRKQAMVKAVPRTDLTTFHDTVQDKGKLSVESLLLELKQERVSRCDAEADSLVLQKEVKKLEADLRATSLQEEEATLRIEQLMQQEKAYKIELQRLKNETENLHNKISKLHTGKQDHEDSIVVLQQRLKEEREFREKVELQLKEQRSQASSQSAWTQEEVRELKTQLANKEADLTKLREESHKHANRNLELQSDLLECKSALRAAQEKSEQLSFSLAGETRVKIELFTALSEARRKHEALAEELKKKNIEVESLQQRMSRLVALQSTWTPSLSPHH